MLQRTPCNLFITTLGPHTASVTINELLMSPSSATIRLTIQLSWNPSSRTKSEIVSVPRPSLKELAESRSSSRERVYSLPKTRPSHLTDHDWQLLQDKVEDLYTDLTIGNTLVRRLKRRSCGFSEVLRRSWQLYAENRYTWLEQCRDAAENRREVRTCPADRLSQQEAHERFRKEMEGFSKEMDAVQWDLETTA